MTHIEPLERRRLLAVDFNYYLPSNWIAPGYVLPGQSFERPYHIQNAGDQTATGTIAVQYRLIPIDASTPRPPQLPDFYHAGAIVLGTFQVVDDFAPGGIGVPVTHQITIPANVAPGEYALMSYLDSANVYHETNESNNYHYHWQQRVIPADGFVVVDGTSGRDVIEVVGIDSPASPPPPTGVEPGLSVRINGKTVDSIGGGRGLQGLVIRAGGGDDVIVIGAAEPRTMRVDGGDGNDKIVGGGGNDFLVGGAGKDVIDGGPGNDRLNGNGGNDKLLGNAGADRLYGYAGNDYLEGGSSNDRLDGGLGADVLYGAGGNDRFFTRDSLVDELFGGSGIDAAQRDVDDVFASVEAALP